MSYFVHRTTFGQIAEVCVAAEVTMTLYVDDLCMSGKNATRALLFKVKDRISAAGLKSHKDRLTRPGTPALVTGVVIDGSQTKLRNVQHERIWAGIEAVEKGDPTGIETLRGQLGAATTIDPKAAGVLQRRLIRAERSARLDDDPPL